MLTYTRLIIDTGGVLCPALIVFKLIFAFFITRRSIHLHKLMSQLIFWGEKKIQASIIIQRKITFVAEGIAQMILGTRFCSVSSKDFVRNLHIQLT